MDIKTKQERSLNMSKIKGINTIPEKILRTSLYKQGFRYRIHFPIFGKPDIVFPKNKIAIFIHGCFWHQHGCKNSTIPKTNIIFWKSKLLGNVKRDEITLKKIKKMGWKAKIIWECEIENNFLKTLKNLVAFLNKNNLTS